MGFWAMIRRGGSPRRVLLSIGLACFVAGYAPAALAQPVPLVAAGQKVDWFAAYKLNASTVQTPADAAHNPCRFGGTVNTGRAGQQYLLATDLAPTLQTGQGLVGTTTGDPVGATFDEIYNGGYHFVVWNDQFYNAPNTAGCSSCGKPWGHSKGILAWDDNGAGVVLQVTTPSWPGSGNASHPRQAAGNTLGCIAVPNNLLYAQHFFGLRLSAADVSTVLDALANASVVTDPANPQLVNNGGPPEIQQRVQRLGVKSTSTTVLDVTLSTGVRLIAKPSLLEVPPWQLVSSLLGGVSLRTATWWASPFIPTTRRGTVPGCWRSDLVAPGDVEIATTGNWAGKKIGLTGGSNHAKIGVSLSGDHAWTIFGDLNQQGAISDLCKSSQNYRGGMFFVVENRALNGSVSALIAGDTAGTDVPSPAKPKVKAAVAPAAHAPTTRRRAAR